MLPTCLRSKKAAIPQSMSLPFQNHKYSYCALEICMLSPIMNGFVLNNWWVCKWKVPNRKCDKILLPVCTTNPSASRPLQWPAERNRAPKLPTRTLPVCPKSRPSSRSVAAGWKIWLWIGERWTGRGLPALVLVFRLVNSAIYSCSTCVNVSLVWLNSFAMAGDKKESGVSESCTFHFNTRFGLGNEDKDGAGQQIVERNW